MLGLPTFCVVKTASGCGTVNSAVYGVDAVAGHMTVVRMQDIKAKVANIGGKVFWWQHALGVLFVHTCSYVCCEVGSC